MACSFTICAVANAAGIFAGCIPASWFMRGLVGVGLLILLLSSAGPTTILAQEIIRSGMGAPMHHWEFWSAIASLLLLILLAVGMMQVLSVAMLSPNCQTACWSRGFTSGLLAGHGCRGLACGHIMETSRADNGLDDRQRQPVMILTVLALGERDTWTTRVRKRFPASRCCDVSPFFSTPARPAESSGGR